ncbi:hypothetical protein [Bradyrhizobium sp. dw_411]|nr:hypothetical protein [Bradyrhizobium sp. dw_411]
MRIMGMVLLVLALTGCTGDRTKQSVSSFAQSLSFVATEFSGS